MKSEKRKIDDDDISFVVISDTHSDLYPEISSLIKKDSYVIHAGDVGDINIINNLKNSCKDIFAVNGNNDNFPDLSKIEIIQTQYGDIVVEHGDKHSIDYHGSLRESHPNALFIVYGHTHKHICDMKTKPYVLNPGASGNTRTQGGASCGLININASGNISVEIKKYTK
tara:strand:- start:2836 stop:3342 length:507 start_codon:yes stop_codon:yes gene_type:complete